jgi:2-polyprenyl-6-methoxyphenol hydroxylase-like FAD-dependent oxidoreductase
MEGSTATPRKVTTQCCVVGGGPAGMMLGYLFARAGVEVVVLEKHKDFFRDFRGDTIHPSTMELMYELGILDEFLKIPHQKIAKLLLSFEGNVVEGPDCSHLPVHCPYIALMPQWDFLDFIAEKAKKYPSFSLMMSAEATGLIEENGRIAGVNVKTPEGELEVRANLVFGTDGRSSIVREKAGLHVEDFGVPIDVLWFRLARPADDTRDFLGRISNGQMMVTINRGDYYQTALIIPKGGFEPIKNEGLDAFRERISAIVPSLRESVKALDGWDKIKLLTVQINRLRKWCRPGLLCIGDAAHAMSPAGGVGINLAIQDAVATANLLSAAILRGDYSMEKLELIQQRRQWPTNMIQAIQVFIHRNMFRKNKDGTQRAISVPWPVRKVMGLFAPIIRRVAARIVGIGFRPEHIHSPENK